MSDNSEDRLLDTILYGSEDARDCSSDEAQRISIKIYGGTARHDSDLCSTCRNAQRMQGLAESEQKVFCSQLGKYIPAPLSKCSRYDDERLPSLYDMKTIAWQLATKGNRQIGFISAEEWKRRKGNVSEGPE